MVWGRGEEAPGTSARLRILQLILGASAAIAFLTKERGLLETGAAVIAVIAFIATVVLRPLEEEVSPSGDAPVRKI